VIVVSHLRLLPLRSPDSLRTKSHITPNFVPTKQRPLLMKSRPVLKVDIPILSKSSLHPNKLAKQVVFKKKAADHQIAAMA